MLYGLAFAAHHSVGHWAEFRRWGECFFIVFLLLSTCSRILVTLLVPMSMTKCVYIAKFLASVQSENSRILVVAVEYGSCDVDAVHSQILNKP